MNRSSLIRLCVRTSLVWIVVCLTILAVQRPLMALLLPYFDFVIRLLQSDFSPALRLMEIRSGWLIEMTPFLLRPMTLTEQLAMRPFITLEAFSVHVDHALVPLVLLVAGVSSWPTANAREALVRVLLTAAALPPLLALTTPVLLAGQVQIGIIELALTHGAQFHEPGLVSLLIFMESGGRWLLPLVLAVACVVVSQRLCIRPLPATQEKARPAPHGGEAMVFPPVSA